MCPDPVMKIMQAYRNQIHSGQNYVCDFEDNTAVTNSERLATYNHST